MRGEKTPLDKIIPLLIAHCQYKRTRGGVKDVKCISKDVKCISNDM